MKDVIILALSVLFTCSSCDKDAQALRQLGFTGELQAFVDEGDDLYRAAAKTQRLIVDGEELFTVVARNPDKEKGTDEWIFVGYFPLGEIEYEPRSLDTEAPDAGLRRFEPSMALNVTLYGNDQPCNEYRLDTTFNNMVHINRFDAETFNLEGSFTARFINVSPFSCAAEIKDTITFTGGRIQTTGISQ